MRVRAAAPPSSPTQRYARYSTLWAGQKSKSEWKRLERRSQAHTAQDSGSAHGSCQLASLHPPPSGVGPRVDSRRIGLPVT